MSQPKSANKIKKNSLLATLFKYRQLYMMMVPGIILVFIFKYIPMGGLAIAFKDFYPSLGFSGSEWVGLHHFRQLFDSPDFWNVFRNTLLISFYKLVFAFPVPILLALLLNEVKNRYFKRGVQTVLYLPHFLSWVVFGGIVINVLSIRGPVNFIIQALGFDPVMFMTSRGWFRAVLVGSNIIKASGWGTVVYLAALSGIDPALYEAAVVDGANRFRKIIHITLPALTGVIVTLFILRLGQILNVGFQQILVLYNPAVYDVADIFETFVYRVGLTEGQFSFATAVGIFKGIVGVIMVTAANRFSKKLGEAGIW